MTISRSSLRAILAFATVALTLGAASAADAAVFCVNDPACPAGGLPKATPNEAMTAANADAVEDTIRIGPGSYSFGGLGSSQPVDIVGAGAGHTTLDHTGSGTAVYLNGSAASSIADLTVRVSQANTVGVRLGEGADATNVAVSGPDSAANAGGFVLEDAGSVLEGIDVDVADGVASNGVYAFAGGTVRDATINAPIGLAGSLTVRRALVRASIGLRAFGHGMNASNVLITRHPRPTSGYFLALSVKNGNNSASASLTASNVTIDGRGAGTGLEVASNANLGVDTGTATATVTGTIIRGVNTAIHRYGQTIDEAATVDIAYSSFDGAAVQSSGFGAVFQGSGNHTTNLDPRFHDPAGLDYRLRYDSPLIDAGRPSELVSEENPDLAGNDRVRDSDGNGSAIRDIGALEYQRVAPTAAFAGTTPAIFVGDAASFDGSESRDPDGDQLTYEWAFGDGATGAGAQTVHVFGAVGSHDVKLTATDPTGLSATTSRTAEILPRPAAGGSGASNDPTAGSTAPATGGSAPKPGACANPLTGTAGRDLLTGLAVGELVRAGAGDDRVLGGAGSDCLDGQRGNDVLLGQAGADRLNGGPGADRLAGGAGRNVVKGGTGNDRVDAANGVRDRVDCGRGGRDTVKADAKDRLTGCERIQKVRAR